MRCTVLGSTPNRAAIFRALSPVSFADKEPKTKNLDITEGRCSVFREGFSVHPDYNRAWTR
jgi:hypothetical protein